MSSANMKLVVLGVKFPDKLPAPPQPKLEPGEHIVPRVVELSKLKAELDGEVSQLNYDLVLLKDLQPRIR